MQQTVQDSTFGELAFDLDRRKLKAGTADTCSESYRCCDSKLAIACGDHHQVDSLVAVVGSARHRSRAVVDDFHLYPSHRMADTRSLASSYSAGSQPERVVGTRGVATTTAAAAAADTARAEGLVLGPKAGPKLRIAASQVATRQKAPGLAQKQPWNLTRRAGTHSRFEACHSLCICHFGCSDSHCSESTGTKLASGRAGNLLPKFSTTVPFSFCSTGRQLRFSVLEQLAAAVAPPVEMELDMQTEGLVGI